VHKVSRCIRNLFSQSDHHQTQAKHLFINTNNQSERATTHRSRNRPNNWKKTDLKNAQLCQV